MKNLVWPTRECLILFLLSWLEEWGGGMAQEIKKDWKKAEIIFENLNQGEMITGLEDIMRLGENLNFLEN